MVMGARMEIKGAEQFARQLKQLGDKSARKVIRGAMRGASLPAKNAMKRRLLGIQGSPRASMKQAIEALSASIEAGGSAEYGKNYLKAMRNLINSLGVVVRTYPSGVIFAVIGPRVGRYKESNIFPGVMAKKIEMGTARTPPRPFVRPVLNETKSQMEAKLRDRLAKGIVREAKRLRKR